MLDLAASCYPGIDLSRLASQIYRWLQDPRVMILLLPDCAVGAALCDRIWTHGSFVQTLFLCGRPGNVFGVVRLCRALAAWGRSRGANEFRLNSWTDSSVEAVALRLRYSRQIATYAVPL